MAELDAAGWDRLRATDSPFGMSQDAGGLAARANAIGEVIAGLGARRVCSYGVGAAALERHLVELPDVTLVCTEYAPETVARLRGFGLDVVEHDLRAGQLDGFDLHLLHRVDTELSNDEWRRYFEHVTEPHLVVVSDFLGPILLLGEAWRRRRRMTDAGWLRTETVFRGLLPPGARRVEVHDLPGFLIV